MTRPAILVTGGTHRIGRSIIEHCDRLGWHVIVHHRRHDELAQQIASNAMSGSCAKFDLSDTDAISTSLEQIVQSGIDLRAAVLNASLFEPDTPEAPDPGIMDRTHRANLAGNVFIASELLRLTSSAQKRTIINILDQKIANLNPDFFSYTLTKTALLSATEMLAMARSDSKDRVYGLAPGLSLPSHDQTDEEFEITGKMNLLKRHNSSEEIAKSVGFLLGGHLKSGTTLFVDSGQHLIAQDRDVMYSTRENYA